MIDDINSDFAYLCNVHPNDTVHYDIDLHVWHKFNSIRFIQHGKKKNSKNRPISHDITSKERIRFERKRKEKKKKKNKRE